MLIITVFCHFDSVTLSKDICILRDILRDQLVLKTEKIRDTTSQAFTMSLIKRTECIARMTGDRSNHMSALPTASGTRRGVG